MHDFMTVETVQFPKGGGQTTPGHSFSDFTFRYSVPITVPVLRIRDILVRILASHLWNRIVIFSSLTFKTPTKKLLLIFEGTFS
jgi:hypothetical protein